MARLVGIDLEPLTLCGSHYKGSTQSNKDYKYSKEGIGFGQESKTT